MTRGPRIVVMPLIRTKYQRGGGARANLSYGPYGRATWQWWCNRNAVDFQVLDEPVPGYASDPPTVQRWAHAAALLEAGAPATEVAVVDADTMIRWDAPNIFDVCDTKTGMGVVIDDTLPYWNHRSIVAHRFLFPDVELPWWRYFNAGVVVLGARHRALLRAFLDFHRENRAALQKLHAGRDFGTDQTPLNYLVRKLGVELQVLPAPFNMLRCLEVPDRVIASIPSITTPQSLACALDRFAPQAFAFMDLGHVWHFARVPVMGWGVPLRAFIMYDTLRRRISEYHGLELPPPPAPSLHPFRAATARQPSMASPGAVG
jgi:hypothetical protein